MRTTLNCREVMRLLRVTRATVRAMLGRGDLRGFQRGKVIRIDPRSVERLLGWDTEGGREPEQMKSGT